jgi:hypothetical protein
MSKMKIKPFNVIDNTDLPEIRLISFLLAEIPLRLTGKCTLSVKRKVREKIVFRKLG